MRSNVCGILFIILIPAIPPVWAGTLVNGRTMLSPQAQVDQRVFTAAFSTAIDAMADITADRGKGFFSDVEEGRGKEAREGYQQAIEFLRGKIVGDIPLTESDLLTLHKFLGRTKIEVTPELAMYIANGGMLSELSNANVPGEYRTSPLLGLQFLEHPLPRSIPQLMRALIEWMNEQDEQITRLEQEGADIKQPLIALAGRVHYLIGIIHPFTDGNGRVARLLTRYLLEKHGYEITGETREEYEVTFGRDFNHNFGIAYGTKRVNIEKATWPELLGKSDAPAFRQFLTKHIRDLSEETLAFYELLEKREVARYFKDEAGVDVDLFMRAITEVSLAGGFDAENIRGVIADAIAQAVSLNSDTIRAGKTEAGLLKEIVMDTNRESLSALLFPEETLTNLEYFLAEGSAILDGERVLLARWEYARVRDVFARVRQLLEGEVADNEFLAPGNRLPTGEAQGRYIENAI